MVKAVGADHSFSGIAVANGVQLDLHKLSGLIDVDQDRMQVTLGGGTYLYQIPLSRIFSPYAIVSTRSAVLPMLT